MPGSGSTSYGADRLAEADLVVVPAGVHLDAAIRRS